jgi:hypothetical protein
VRVTVFSGDLSAYGFVQWPLVAASDKQAGHAPAQATPASAPKAGVAPGRVGQAERGDGTSAVHRASVFGVSGAAAPLPFASQIQKAFGKHDVSNVQAYTDPAAVESNREMNAEAYTRGNQIAFGRTPDLHLVAEEAAHVVQQRAGVKLSGGVGKPDDAYEHHAHAVADAVVAGQSAEPILDMMATPADKGEDTPSGEASVQMRSASGGPSAKKDPFDALFGTMGHRAVNRVGAVQAELGLRLRKKPGGGGGSIIKHGTMVTILHESEHRNENERWAYVTSTHGSGFVERQWVTTDIPECSAKLHLIKKDETLGGIAAKFYSKHFSSGNDARLYVQALYHANKHRTGISLTEAQLSGWEKATRGKSEEETLKIYKSVQVIDGESIWIPSEDFVQQLKKHGAITSGQTTIKKAWDSAKHAVEDAWDDVKYVAGLTAGLIHGAANAVYDLFKGAAELTGKVISIVAKLVTGDLGGALGVATGWVKELAKMWKNRGAIKDGFVQQWTQEDGWRRGNFQGETIGWILTSLALMFVSGGSSSTGMVAVLATKFPTMVRAIQAAGKLGDSLTWAKSAGKGAKKIGGKAKDEVKKVMGAAKKAADKRKRKKAAARERAREKGNDKGEKKKKKKDDGPGKKARARWAAMIKRGTAFQHVVVEKAGSSTETVMMVRATGNFLKSIYKHTSEQTQGVQLQEKDSNSCGMPKVEITPHGLAVLRKQLKGAHGSLARQLIAFAHGQQDSVVFTGGSASGGSGAKLFVQLAYKASPNGIRT